MTPRERHDIAYIVGAVVALVFVGVLYLVLTR
jgi:hypothetical protein